MICLCSFKNRISLQDYKNGYGTRLQKWICNKITKMYMQQVCDTRIKAKENWFDVTRKKTIMDAGRRANTKKTRMRHNYIKCNIV